MSAIIIAENGLVHYEALGRGKPVLFLHGWIGSGAIDADHGSRVRPVPHVCL
jgi:pimeloyl-ACP methyl ester carboxylesterase